MKILKLNKESILIELDVLPASITDTVADAFLRVGMQVQPEYEAVCFSGRGGVLIVAKQTRPACAVYRFASFEDLLFGAQAVLHTCTSPTTLIHHENTYFLILSDEMQPLSEFGDAVENPETISAYLHEHGNVLCRDDAVQKLCRVFC